jgi:putative NADH-flavin reductase
MDSRSLLPAKGDQEYAYAAVLRQEFQHFSIRPMKIVVFGASGKTGKLLVAEALASGHHVIAYVRNRDSISSEHPNLEVVVGLLNEKDKLRAAIAGADACVSTLGGTSLMRHSPEIIQGIDHIVATMEAEGVQRLVYLSSIGAGDSRYYMPRIARFLILDLFLRVPIADHNANEKRIANSKLQATIVRPGSLTDGVKTGNLKHGSAAVQLKGNPSISRADVAGFLLQLLVDGIYVNEHVWLHA